MRQIQRRTLARYAGYWCGNKEASARSSGMIWKRFIYTTNVGSKTNAARFDRNAAHPSRTRKKPRYIGFRVYLYTPETISDDVESGFIGLTVVFARRNDTTPERHVTTPISARPTDKRGCAGRTKSKRGAADEAIHMSAATITTSATGGSFNARPFCRCCRSGRFK